MECSYAYKPARIELRFTNLIQGCLTTALLSMSSAEVVSSSRRILGLRTRARAMAILCFCPPLSWALVSPTRVSNLYNTENTGGLNNRISYLSSDF